MREDYVDAVLEIVARIPPGKVLAYGDVAELLGTGGPRQVGFVMSRYGSSVPWWRVIRASGEPPSCHGGEAGGYYQREQTPLRAGRAEGGEGRYPYRTLAPDRTGVATDRVPRG